MLSIAGLGLLGLSKATNAGLAQHVNEILKSIAEKFTSASNARPEERVYLHLDKPFYKPGESIWFKVYLRNGTDLKASSQSDIVHIEFINPKGSIEKKYALIAKNGHANGDLTIDEDMPGGLYKIKAYTNWQKNENMYYEREIQVQSVVLPRLLMSLEYQKKAYGPGDKVTAVLKFTTIENNPLANKTYRYVASISGKSIFEKTAITDAEGNSSISFTLPAELKNNDALLNVIIEHEGNTESISRSIPIVLHDIKLSFYPEGGDMVAGIPCRVAFKAINEFGKAADVEGYVMDSKKQIVANFASYHMGMGTFDIIPLKSETYTAVITKPANIKSTYPLPAALEKGYTMCLKQQQENLLPIEIYSTEFEELSILAQMRGQIYYMQSFQAHYGKNTLQISTEKFPIGVAQITLFDSKGIARAERLTFLNKHRQLRINIETDKEKYLPREKVHMTIKVTDERGIPMPANLSLSVVDEKILSFADDKQGHILSSMLLEQDLNCKVEEPKFYFDSSNEKATQALDYLLMTAGWRKFTWAQLTDNQLPPYTYPAERAIVGGIVYDGYKNMPLHNAEISVENTTIKTTTDASGKFSLSGLELYEPIKIKVSAPGYTYQYIYATEYKDQYTAYLYDQKIYKNYDHKLYFRNDANIMRIIPPVMQGRAKEANFETEAELMLANNEDLFKNKVLPAGTKINTKKEQAEMAQVVQATIADIRLKKKPNHDKAEMPVSTKYYRARVFAAPDYTNAQQPDVRTDFRSTIYWNGNIETDRNGKAVISFFNSDEVSSFCVTIEGFGKDGSIGRAEKKYYTQLPFSMQVKLPVEVVMGDVLCIPLTLKNNTASVINGSISIKTPKGWQLNSNHQTKVSILPHETKTLLYEYKVLREQGKDTIMFAFSSAGVKDAFVQEIEILPAGFPASVSFSGREHEKEYSFVIDKLVEGSLQAGFTAYPSVVSDLLKGIESILREPYGCFEQTSTSNYPNIMVKKYLEETGNPVLSADIDIKLDKGYKRLITFETKEKGYEWFGGTPAHEGLTAYGLMQFHDMQQVYPLVDKAMVDRTAAWLMSRRDGQGGFMRNAKALDQFGRASQDITNAYIVYALSEAGYRDIEKELHTAYSKALSSDDPYQMALLANAMYNFGYKDKAAKLMDKLYLHQQKDGAFKGATHSITYSQGKSLDIETTALAVLAMIKSASPNGKALNKAVEYIVSSRSGTGGFASTQGTILALKALTEYAKFSKKTDEDGSIEIYANGKKVSTLHYKAGQTEPVSMENLASYLSVGRNTIRIKYIHVQNPLPYTVSVNWTTTQPTTDVECKVTLTTSLNTKSLFVGETARMSVILKNKTHEGLPMTMAIIGIPAGLSLQPWQLKELQEKNVFDFYEVRNNTLFIYYRQMKPDETREIYLDLKADVAGEYEALASCAYLYYTNEYKWWCAPERISIKRK